MEQSCGSQTRRGEKLKLSAGIRARRERGEEGREKKREREKEKTVLLHMQNAKATGLILVQKGCATHTQLKPGNEQQHLHAAPSGLPCAGKPNFSFWKESRLAVPQKAPISRKVPE